MIVCTRVFSGCTIYCYKKIMIFRIVKVLKNYKNRSIIPNSCYVLMLKKLRNIKNSLLLEELF